MKIVNLILLSFLFLNCVEANAQRFTSQYDNKADTISIDADNVPVLDIFRRIGLQTGIEILADHQITQTTTYRVQNVRLEQAIKQISRGLNTAIFYQESGKNGPIISRIRILPKGVDDVTRAMPLLKLENEAVAYAKFSSSSQSRFATTGGNRDGASYDYLETRWLARVSKMSLEDRAQVEEIVRNESDQRDKRRAMADERRELAVKRKQDELARLQEVERQMQEEDPERYQLRLQRIEKAKQETMHKRGIQVSEQE